MSNLLQKADPLPYGPLEGTLQPSSFVASPQYPAVGLRKLVSEPFPKSHGFFISEDLGPIDRDRGVLRYRSTGILTLFRHSLRYGMSRKFAILYEFGWRIQNVLESQPVEWHFWKKSRHLHSVEMRLGPVKRQLLIR